MPIKVIEANGREYAIVYAVIDGKLVVIDIGEVHHAPGEAYIVPTSPSERELAYRAWLSRFASLRDRIKPRPRRG
ncbi:hypothetical protein JCM16161A_02070 [Vulcanisaeta sp. JCM 16161]|uniref:hypothetical protein n=1 Tax=Vulcanisaeta sp. JCM 16161 TaxID=1295372 RepID=UPI0006D0F73E|nr:hypothetical protein [Vulcanisaeta sp. JCM 16161]